MKKLLILCVVTLLALTVAGLFPVHGEEAVYDSVVRLHIVANSDSESDQKLKLSVRDAVSQRVEALTADCQSLDEVLTRLSESIGEIEQTAREAVAAQGCDYPVSVLLGRESYPERSYDSICFPSGEYESLRILIGEAVGQNWWCVLFPRLCLGAASADAADEAFAAVGLTPEQYRIITETDDTKYKIRFKILETIEEAFG